MKLIKTHLKLVALFFSALIFFQGCTVYKPMPISIEQAVQNESKVMVITKSNEKIKFNKIEIEDGKYFGVKNSKEAIVKTPLDQNFINSINEKDKTLTTIFTILTIAVPVVLIAVLVYLIGDGARLDIDETQG